MKKNNYSSPEIRIEFFRTEDVITISLVPVVYTGGGDDDTVDVNDYPGVQ